MAFIDTEIERTIQRPRVLLELRQPQCSYLRPSDETRLDTYTGRTGNGGDSLFSNAGRVGRLPLEDREAGASGELRHSDEPDSFDPFADWQNSPPVVYPEGCEHPSDRVWYLIGRSHGKEEQFAALMPVIEEIIERVSK